MTDAQWVTALHYGLALQQPKHLSWIIWDPKRLTLLDYPTMGLKPKACCSHIADTLVVSVFTLSPAIMFTQVL